MDLTQIKQRFSIIGNNPELNRAIEVACQVAATDLSVLVTGESGVGKEFIPKIIHDQSNRRFGVYIAVNCGAIPGGTIDSELFGHEKGAFTGATETRKGYFEEANGGTLFLDEVAELPLSTQVRLLRVLQTGEFIRVGSSKVLKTDVRVVAATNINLRNAVAEGRFREDLFYRLNTVPIKIPALRERKEDIHLLFRKFALDYADKYNVPAVRLDDDAVQMLCNYRWPGNIRQLKSVAEQISILEKDRHIHAEVLQKYLPVDNELNVPVLTGSQSADYLSDRDIIFKILFQLRQEISDLKQKVEEMQQPAALPATPRHASEGLVIDDIDNIEEQHYTHPVDKPVEVQHEDLTPPQPAAPVSLQDATRDLIIKALERNGGRRKATAEELGFSERTLYRKIKELGLE
ncbi:MAG: sigma-54-dependent Fis family transcriptional regulator [Bacteroidales bacterium]|nr:sigma-54-dependent Fis family transcriptional regulator [Bacteroidales bacterium]